VVLSNEIDDRSPGRKLALPALHNAADHYFIVVEQIGQAFARSEVLEASLRPQQGRLSQAQ
jgi:hypothetical protein